MAAKVLTALCNNPGASDRSLAKQTGCSAPHIAAIINHVTAGSFQQWVTAAPAGQRPVLSAEKEVELAYKFANMEFKSAAELAAYCGPEWSKDDAYNLARAHNYSFRTASSRAKPPAKSTDDPVGQVHGLRRLKFEESDEALEILRLRQIVERKRWGILEGEYRKPGARHIGDVEPVLRLEAIIRIATTTQSFEMIREALGCSRSDLYAWQDIFMKGGVDALCGNGPAPESFEEAVVEPSRFAFTTRDSMKWCLETVLPKWSGIETSTLAFIYGIRGVGKSTLIREALKDALYLDCASLTDDELRGLSEFLAKRSEQTVILDEVDRLKNPGDLLFEVGAIKNTVVAVASTLNIAGAEDAGLMPEFGIELLPLLWEDRLRMLNKEGGGSAKDALVRPGLPAMFNGQNLRQAYREWARSLHDREFAECACAGDEFINGLENLMRNSGDIPDGGGELFCRRIGASGKSTLDLLLAAGVFFPVPLLDDSRTRLFASDHGWHRELTRTSGGDDLEKLWKHVVLLELRHSLRDLRSRERRGRLIYAWNRTGASIDFAVRTEGNEWTAVMSDWSGRLHLAAFKSFRRKFSGRRNIIVTPRPQHERIVEDGIEFEITGPRFLRLY